MTEQALSIAIILLTAGLSAAILFTMPRRRSPQRQQLRRSGKILNATLAEALERGDAAHVDISAQLNETNNGTTIPALTVANLVAARSAAADNPPIFTGDDGLTTALTDRAVSAAYHATDLETSYDTTNIRFTAGNPVAHQGTLLTALDETHEPMHLSIGSAGPEIALQDLAFEQRESVLVAGSNLEAQSVALVSAEDTFIGEEVYSLPALLSSENNQDATADGALLTMDFLRTLILAGIPLTILLLRLLGK